MTDIKTITANSDEKNDVYTLLCMVHTMAMQEALTSKTWWLKSTDSWPDYTMTTMTNDIVDVIAESRYGNHTYTMKAAEGL